MADFEFHVRIVARVSVHVDSTATIARDAILGSIEMALEGHTWLAIKGNSLCRIERADMERIELVITFEEPPP